MYSRETERWSIIVRAHSLTRGFRLLIAHFNSNFIPVAGTILFLALNGAKSGPSSHARYFQLKGLNKTQQEKFVHERQGAYTA